MAKVKDQAGRLYAAEAISGLKFGESMTLKECQKFVDKVTARQYVTSNYGKATIMVLDGRGRRSACASYSGGQKAIKLPKWARTKYVILHEVAHHISGGAGHKAEFASCLLDLVRHFLGKESADALQGAYYYKGVKVVGKKGATKARCPQSRQDWVEVQKIKDQELKEKLAQVS